MPWMGLIAVGGGAAAGAWMRWGFAALLNPLSPTFPIGTLAANLIGGLLVGIFMAAAEPLQLTHTQRLLIATGFLGGLTTFSTFSGETLALLMDSKYLSAAALATAHLAGSLIMTGTGIALTRTFLAR